MAEDASILVQLVASRSSSPVKGSNMPRAITLEEAADRLAIRELIDAYAHCADRRDAKGQMALFAEDTAFHVFMDSRSPEPTYILHGRDALAPVFADLNQYRATTHFNGQSTVRLDGDHATGESYCIAHHLTVDGEARTLMLASIRYLDQFVKLNGAWLFAERKLMVDWTETRVSKP
jgi:ketosteroid isomerase-like protein